MKQVMVIWFLTPGSKLAALFHHSSVKGLNGPDIVGIKFCKSVDLFLRDLHGSLQDEPRDALHARRGCLRTHVHVIAGVMGQQIGGIYLGSSDLAHVTRSLRHIFPELLDGGVSAARFQKNCDTGDFSIAVFMHQVQRHVVLLPENVFLARTMEVELCEFVALFAHTTKFTVFPFAPLFRCPLLAETGWQPDLDVLVGAVSAGTR